MGLGCVDHFGAEKKKGKKERKRGEQVMLGWAFAGCRLLRKSKKKEKIEKGMR